MMRNTGMATIWMGAMALLLGCSARPAFRESPAPSVGLPGECEAGPCEAPCAAGLMRRETACVPCPMAANGSRACPGHWSAPMRVSTGVNDEADTPQVQMTTQGIVMIAWVQGDKGQRRVRARWFDPVARQWSGAQALSQSAFDDGRAPRLAAQADGSVMLAWVERSESGFGLHSRRWSGQTRTWSAPQRLGYTFSRRGGALVAPGLGAPTLQADAAGNMHVFWSQGDGEREIQARRFDAVLGTWSTLFGVSARRLDDAIDPQVAVAADGQAFVVWSEGDPGDRVILCRRFWPPSQTPPVQAAPAAAGGPL